jgi:hypothetical protein
MEVLKLYKREGGEERRGSTVSITLRYRISDLTDEHADVIRGGR